MMTMTNTTRPYISEYITARDCGSEAEVDSYLGFARRWFAIRGIDYHAERGRGPRVSDLTAIDARRLVQECFRAWCAGTTIAMRLAALPIADAEAEADKLCAEGARDQDWNLEATLWTFADGSRLRSRDGDLTVVPVDAESFRLVVGERGNEQGHIISTLALTEEEACEALAVALESYRGGGWGRVEYRRPGGWDRLEDRAAAHVLS